MDRFQTGLTGVAIFEAIGTGINALKAFVESNNFINIDKQYGMHSQTLLHHMVRCGSFECVKYLIEKGANVDALDKYGDTPLHDAAYFAHYDIVKYLLESGADNQRLNNYGRTVWHEAECGRGKDSQLAKYIESFEAVPTKGVHLCE